MNASFPSFTHPTLSDNGPCKRAGTTRDHWVGKTTRAAALTALCVLMSACGGGGGDSGGSALGGGSGGGGNGGGNGGGGGGGATKDLPAGTTMSPNEVPTGFGPDYSDGQATLSALSAGRAAWNVSSAARATLRSSPGGPLVGGALACVSDAPMQLEVAANCSTAKGLRLGVHTVTVTGGGVSAKASVKVIPPPQPLGTGFSTVDGLNVVVAPDGRPLVWGNRSNAPIARRSSGLDSTLARPDAFLASNQQVVGGMVAAGRSSLGFVTLSEDGEVYTLGNPRILGRLRVLDVPDGPYGSFLESISFPFDRYFGKVRMSDGGPPLQKVVAISMGYDNVMALTDEGQVYFWGSFQGTFANAQAADRVPRLMPLPDKAVAVAGGSNWCLVLLANGRVMTVLPSGEGFDRQAGRPATATSFSPGFVVDRAGTPLEGITSIAAGRYNGFAVNTLGQVWAWGQSNFDQLGQGVLAARATGALLVRSPDGQGYLSGIVKVASGADHTLALHRSSQVYSWGYNDRGQLGDAKRRTLLTENYGGIPGLVLNEAGTAPMTGVRFIDAGLGYSQALGADGQLRTWGSGASESLGQGASVSYSYLPLLVTNEAANAPLSFAPMSRWPD